MSHQASVAGTKSGAATSSRAAAPSERTSLADRLRNASRRIDWFAVGGLVLLALFLKPALHGAFRADDTWNSVIRGHLELNGQALVSNIATGLEHYMFDSGRPNALQVIQGTLTVWLFQDEFGYHAFLLLTTLLAAGVLYALVRELGLSRAGGLLVITVLAGALQLRSYHDALLGYSGTVQIVLALTFASLLMFVRGLRRNDKRLLVVSFLLFLPCPLLYEGTYTLVAAHAGIALVERRGWDAVRASLPFLVLGAVFVALSYLLRASAPSVVPGYEVGGSLLEALRTYAIQLLAPLPASNLTFKANYGAFLPLGGNPTKPEILAGLWRGAAVFALVLAISLSLARAGGSRLPPVRTLWNMAVVGGLLWTTSVIIISFAPKYQGEIIAGRGHLPALIQVFGWALVVSATLFALLRAAVGRSIIAVRVVAVSAAGLLALGAGFLGYNNMRVVGLEAPIRETRSLLERAAENGAFESLSEDATLVFSDRDLRWPTGRWNQVTDAHESLLMASSGRRYDARLLPSAGAEFDCSNSEVYPASDCEPLRADAAWVRVRPRPGGGTVVIGRLSQSSISKALAQTTTEPRAFVYDEESPVQAPSLLGTTKRGRPWSSDQLEWRRVESGDNWAIFETQVSSGPLPVASSLDAADGRVDFTALPAPDQIVRIYGTKHLLP
jgi:hypothetical protein